MPAPTKTAPKTPSTSRAMALLMKASRLDEAALNAAIIANLDALVAVLVGAKAPALPDAGAVALAAYLHAGGHKPGSPVWKAAVAHAGGRRALTRAAPKAGVREALVAMLTAGGHKPGSPTYVRAMAAL